MSRFMSVGSALSLSAFPLSWSHCCPHPGPEFPQVRPASLCNLSRLPSASQPLLQARIKGHFPSGSRFLPPSWPPGLSTQPGHLPLLSFFWMVPSAQLPVQHFSKKGPWTCVRGPHGVVQNMDSTETGPVANTNARTDS